LLADDPEKWAEFLDEVWCIGSPYSERISILASFMADAMDAARKAKPKPIIEET
jgi:hypothetical protein